VAIITIEQHWYGSAPVGLEVSRGFQTLAHSPGLTDFKALKPHCYYKKPAGSREGPPVAWGWFNLDAERVCVYRIGDAGTDELGRMGNILAHNLVVRRTDLDAIDFDIPALVRWVRQRSPYRYRDESGREDGFAASYVGLHQLLDPGCEVPDKARLQQAPILQVPTDDLARIRADMDAELEAGLLQELQQRLKPAFLEGVLRAFLSPPDQRRPVLLIGLGNGARESELEWKLVEWLFTVLPACCRQDLTFTTYENDIATMLSPPRAGSVPAPHRPRRLIITTTLNDTRLPPTARNIPLWLGNTKTGQLMMPPTPTLDLPGQVSKWMSRGEYSEVFEFRDAANAFRFPEPWSGMCDAWQIWDLPRREVEFDDYPTFIRLADCPRPGQSFVLQVGLQLTQRAEQLLAQKQVLRGHFARMYIQALCLQMPRLDPEEQTGLLEESAWSLASFFRWALYPGSEEHLAYLFRVFAASPSLQSLHPVALKALRQNLAGKDHLDRAEALLGLCHQVRQQVGSTAGVGTFLTGAGALLLDLLERALKGGYKLQLPLEQGVLPTLKTLAVERVQDLERRLHLLARLTTSPEAGTDYLLALDRGGLVPDGLLASLQRDPPAFLLGHYPAWREAARSASRFRPLLGHPGLLARYGEAGTGGAALDLADPLPHRAVPLVVQDAEQLQRVEEVARWYAATGQAASRTHLRTPPRGLRREALLALPLAQAAVMQAVLPELTGASRGLVTEHLAQLLAFVLAIPPLPGWSAESVEPILSSLVPPVVQWFPEAETRLRLLENVTERAAALREEWGISPETPLPLLDLLPVTLADCGVEKAEASWHANWLEQSLRKPDTPENLTRRTAAGVLQQVPSVAGAAGRATPFGAWLAGQIDFEVWKSLAERLGRDLLPGRLAEEGPRWFAPDGERAPLLERLDEQGLLASLGKALAREYARNEDASLEALAALVYLPLPASLAAPVKHRLGEHLIVRLQQLGKLVEHRNARDSDWYPSLDEARAVVKSLLAPLTAGADTVPVDWLCFAWDYLSRALTVFALQDVAVRNTFRDLFPTIFRYGRILGMRRQAPNDQIWGELFRQAAESDRVGSKEFGQLFVSACEGLVSEGLLVETRQLLEARKGDLLFDRFHSGDPLFPVLCQKPPEVENSQVAGEEEINAVFYRAQLAGLAYEVDDPEKLADLVLGMGFPQGEIAQGALFYPRVSALAVYALLILEGTATDTVVARRDELLRSGFWKPFVRGLGTHGRQFYAELKALFEELLAEQDRERVLRPFYRQFHPRRPE
jgi:hypothetical protein